MALARSDDKWIFPATSIVLPMNLSHPRSFHAVASSSGFGLVCRLEVATLNLDSIFRFGTCSPARP